MGLGGLGGLGEKKGQIVRADTDILADLGSGGHKSSCTFFFSCRKKKKTEDSRHVTLYPIRRFFVPENSISLLRAAPSVHVSLSGCHSYDIFGSFFHDIINFKGYTHLLYIVKVMHVVVSPQLVNNGPFPCFVILRKCWAVKKTQTLPATWKAKKRRILFWSFIQFLQRDAHYARHTHILYAIS